MLRKILVTSFLFTMTAQMAAADIAPYAGVSAALYTGPWKVKNAATTTTDFISTGGGGGVFGGFSGYLYPHMYLAGEVFFNGSSTSTRTKVVDALGTQARMRTTYMMGLSFIPGYYVTRDFVVFLRGGVVGTRFETTNIAPDGSKSRSYSTQPGGQVGMGMQYALTEHLKARAEYSYIAYQFYNAFNKQISPQNNQFSIGILYQV